MACLFFTRFCFVLRDITYTKNKRRFSSGICLSNEKQRYGCNALFHCTMKPTEHFNMFLLFRIRQQLVTQNTKRAKLACGLGQHFRDLGHSFSLYGPPSQQITYMYHRWIFPSVIIVYYILSPNK